MPRLWEHQPKQCHTVSSMRCDTESGKWVHHFESEALPSVRDCQPREFPPVHQVQGRYASGGCWWVTLDHADGDVTRGLWAPLGAYGVVHIPVW